MSSSKRRLLFCARVASLAFAVALLTRSPLTPPFAACIIVISPPAMFFLMWYYKGELPAEAKEFDIVKLKKK
jgi:hypothetical protein